MDNITASEVAGFGVGTLLLCATIAAPKVDAFISSSQRSALGMCKRCGDVKLIPCKKCKGVGSIQGGFNPIAGLYNLTFGGGGVDDGGQNSISVPCSNCNARGHFICPQCCL